VTALTLNVFLRPLKYLFKATTSIKDRKFDLEIPVFNHDEIGQISEQFNSMSRELDGFYKSLEQKVRDAVDGLRATNQQLKERTGELEKLNTLLKAIDRRKSEFISIVSHDLRTPLTSILGFADTLLNRKLNLADADKEKYLNIIRAEAKRLSRLISDFLDISRIEEGQMSIQVNKNEIVALIHNTVKAIDTGNKNLTITVTSDPECPKTYFDGDRIVQVIQNLLVNAIKYSPDNSAIRIHAGKSGNDMKVSITDIGGGIPDNEKTRIFEKYYRRDDEVSRKERGSGLGLSIAKSIVELHGGRIWVEDAVPSGSTFIFTLPCRG
jgi:signal transduction histidine kinase